MKSCINTVIFTFVLILAISSAFADEILPVSEELRYYIPDIFDNSVADNIFVCMLATAIIETLFFAIFKTYRIPYFLLYIAGINLFSNLIANIALYRVAKFITKNIALNPMSIHKIIPIIIAIETGVCLFEFVAVGLKTRYNKETFAMVLSSNILSYSFGLLYFTIYR